MSEGYSQGQGLGVLPMEPRYHRRMLVSSVLSEYHQLFLWRGLFEFASVPLPRQALKPHQWIPLPGPASPARGPVSRTYPVDEHVCVARGEAVSGRNRRPWICFAFACSGVRQTTTMCGCKRRGIQLERKTTANRTQDFVHQPHH